MVSAFCCIAHSHWHTHRCRPVAVMCGEGYRVEQLFFFHTDWPSGPETHAHTDAQTHKYTTHIYTRMQPSHLGSIIPFVWSSKQLANSMNYYNPIRHLGCCSTGRPVCLCVRPCVCMASIYHLSYHGRWNSHTLPDTPAHTRSSFLPYQSVCIFYLQIMFCLFPLCYHAATNGKTASHSSLWGFLAAHFFSRGHVCVCGSCGWHSNSGRQMAISLSLWPCWTLPRKIIGAKNGFHFSLYYRI